MMGGRLASGRLIVGPAVLLFLVGCASGSTPPPSSPAATVPSSTAVATPTAATPPQPGSTGLARALVDVLNAYPLVVHVEETGVVDGVAGTNAGKSAHGKFTFDIAGDSYAMHATGTSEKGEAFDWEIIVVDGMKYERLNEGAWTSTPALPGSIADLTKGLRLTDDPAAFTYVGPETVEGRQLHHLTALGTIPYGESANGTGKYDSFDVWVDNAGMPVVVKMVYTATDNATVSLTRGIVELRYSAFGGPITIVSPSVTLSH